MNKIINKIPKQSGIYLFKDEKGEILYIGKAKALDKRVKSYFVNSKKDVKTSVMVEKIRDIDCIVTANEVEAFVLESNMIKRFKPRYNILLKDDKHYPYLKITLKEAYPRLLITRKFKKDGNLYFGPYVKAKAIRKTIMLIYKIFPVRQCKGTIKSGILKRPCVNYQMKRCSGVCSGLIQKERYRKIIDLIILFLKGDNKDLFIKLNCAMERYSKEEKYEKAALLRDQILSLEHVMKSQNIISTAGEEQDVLAINNDNSINNIVFIFIIRGGILIGSDKIGLYNYQDKSSSELLESFLKQYYSKGIYIPKEIIIGNDICERVELEKWLSGLKGGKVSIRVPKKGRKKELLDMAVKNITYSARRSYNPALAELKGLLQMDELPLVIDALDISNISGKMAVGSCVVYIDGYASKEHYRKYNIKSTDSVGDCSMLKEVVIRRYSKNLSYDLMPDIILIDGGRGQLNAVVQELSLRNLAAGVRCIISISKGKDRNKADSHLIHYKDEILSIPIKFIRGRNLLLEIRDEAHRFAISCHRDIRRKESLVSVLDDIPGIGKRRKAKLINKFKSVKGIEQADPCDIAVTASISSEMALKVIEGLKIKTGTNQR